MGLVESIKQKLGMVESSRYSLPTSGAGDLDEVFRTMLGTENIRQTSFIDEMQQIIISAWLAYNNVDDENDIEGFSREMAINLLETSVSVNGYRSEQLQNIAVGLRTRDFQMELAKIRSGASDNSELKEAI